CADPRDDGPTQARPRRPLNGPLLAALDLDRQRSIHVTQRVPIDPDKGLDDLVKQLAEDSKRLMSDEVRLAKLEAAESLHEAGTGGMWLGVAFGVAIVALVAFTLFFATLFGRIANGHHWVGALLTAALEIAVG